ncbi:MAG: histone deacetylase family protein [Candidatus Bipolaricaulaceae bacterium]
MEIIFSERCLEYHRVGHPEGPARLRVGREYLERKGYQFLEPQPATRRDLLSVHAEEHVRRVETGDFYDPDCPAYEGIDFYARLAVGGAMLAQQRKAFSYIRPPGHHAGPSFLGGFCYYNNLAIAVRLSGKRTLIVDIDGHHGNGTQAVFFGDPQVTYVSLHRMYNYPGTGHQSQANCHNYPLPPRCGREQYLDTLEQALQEAGEGYGQMAISVGFDTYKDDPLAALGLEVDSFYDIGYTLGEVALPTFCVLEGGYVPEIMGPATDGLIRGLEEAAATAAR